MTKFKFFYIILTFIIITGLNSCGLYKRSDVKDTPVNVNERVKNNIQEGRGIRFGRGATRGGDFDFASSNPLWRASIEIFDFVPLTNASYSGGIIITDWFSGSSGEGSNQRNLKITVNFLSNEVRADAIDVIIHEKSPDNKNRVVIKARNGELVSASINQELKLILFNGNRYEEIFTKKPEEKLRYKHAKVSFEKSIMNVDLSNFNNVDVAEEKYTSTYKMQKVNELYNSIDSLEEKFNKSKVTYADNLIKTRINLNPKLVDLDQKKSAKVSSIYCENPNPLTFIVDTLYNQHILTLNRASNNIKTISRNWESKKRVFFSNQKIINLHKTTLNDRYTLGFSIFFLFIIGASLGAIIRKGGLGFPIVLAVLIFLTYHYIGLFGKNAAEDNTISPIVGSWISVIIIIPFAVYLVNRATNDRGITNYKFIISLSDIFEKIKEKVRWVKKKK